MKKYFLLLMIFFLSFFFVTFCSDKQNRSIKDFVYFFFIKDSPKKLKTSLYSLSNRGLDKKLGTVIVTENDTGISIFIEANGLVPGEHGMHIHEKNNMMPSKDKNGNDIIGGMAGEHWDPNDTKQHLGPNGGGHKGDLPKILVPLSGKLKTTIKIAEVYIVDIKDKSIIIHAKGDNYSDNPNLLGGGGARAYAIKF